MNDMLRIGELEAALLQWKCPSCGGSGDYLNRTKDGAGYVPCKVCNGRGLHPVAHAALKPVLPEFHRGGLWDGQQKLDQFLKWAISSARAGNPTVVYANLRAANHVAEDMAHVEGRVFSKIPDYWFTYAGDGYARAYGIPTKASFLWPKHQKAIQEQKARDQAAREKRIADAAEARRDREDGWHRFEGTVPDLTYVTWEWVKVRYQDGTEAPITKDFDWLADRGSNPIIAYFDDIPF